MSQMNRRQALKMAATGLAGATLTPDELASERTATRAGGLEESSGSSVAKSGGFHELPVGSVRPLGWILGEMQKQAVGITGNLTSLYAPFRGTAWATDEMSNSTPWVPWEVRAYWCDGAIRCGILLSDADLFRKATELL